MIRKLFLVCAGVCLCACASFSSQRDEYSNSSAASGSFSAIEGNFWTTLPKPDSLVLIGASAPQSRPEYEINAAREDAARKASMFHGLLASNESVQSIGTGLFNYYADAETTIIYDDYLDPYIDKLKFDPALDMAKIGAYTFIRFSYPAVFPETINLRFGKNPNGSPGWTTRPPAEISGYLAGVGYARRQQRINQTCARSFESAIAGLVSQVSASVSVADSSVVTGNTVRNTSIVYHESRGRLENFLILEIWIDPVTEAVWTLAIAKKEP